MYCLDSDENMIRSSFAGETLIVNVCHLLPSHGCGAASDTVSYFASLGLVLRGESQAYTCPLSLGGHKQQLC